MVEINKSYVAGLLDSRGCFYIVNKKTKKYLYFKLKIKDIKTFDKIYDFIISNLSIKARNWKDIIYVTDIENMLKLILFMRENCYRDDYEQILKDNDFGFNIKNH